MGDNWFEFWEWVRYGNFYHHSRNLCGAYHDFETAEVNEKQYSGLGDFDCDDE